MLLISETEKKIVTVCPIAYQVLFIWGENWTSKTGIANFYGDLCVGCRPVVSINWRSESYCRHSAAHVLPNSAFMRFQRLNSSAQSHFYQIENNVQIFTDHDKCQRIITQLSVWFTWLQNKLNIYQEVLDLCCTEMKWHKFLWHSWWHFCLNASPDVNVLWSIIPCQFSWLSSHHRNMFLSTS